MIRGGLPGRHQHPVRIDLPASCAPSGALARRSEQRTALFQRDFSVISLAEICKGIAKLPESRKRAQLQDWLDSVLRPWFSGRILSVTEPIAERLGYWAGDGEARGRTIKIADGLIAATAAEHDLTLVTRNVKDFTAFGIRILNPWDEV